MIAKQLFIGHGFQLTFESYDRMAAFFREQEAMRPEDRELFSQICQHNRDSLVILGELDAQASGSWLARKKSLFRFDYQVPRRDHATEPTLFIRRLYGLVHSITKRDVSFTFWDQLGNMSTGRIARKILFEQFALREKVKSLRERRELDRRKLHPDLEVDSVVVCELIRSKEGLAWEFEPIPIAEPSEDVLPNTVEETEDYKESLFQNLTLQDMNKPIFEIIPNPFNRKTRESPGISDSGVDTAMHGQRDIQENMRSQECLLRIHVIGSGFGESIVVGLPDGQWGVIDCYSPDLWTPESNPSLQILSGIDRLLFLCLTHPDDDHIMGVSQIIERFADKIDNLWQFDAVGMRRLINYLKVMHSQKHHELLPKEAQRLRNKAFELQKLDKWSEQIGKEPSRLSGEWRSLYSKNLSLPDGSKTLLEIWSIGPSGKNVSMYEREISRLGTFEGAEYRLRVTGNNREPKGNLLSGVMGIDYGKTRIVFGGDTERGTWKWVSKKQPVYKPFTANCVKVSHHGSTQGYCDETWPILLLDAARDKERHGDGPIAVVTPFRQKRLPRRKALEYISQFAYEGFLTSKTVKGTMRYRFGERTYWRDYEEDVADAKVFKELEWIGVPSPGICSLAFDWNGECLHKQVSGQAKRIWP